MQNILEVFKALSDETRLRILNLLLQRECCVCEIMQAMRISHSRASRGLTALHNAGLLQSRRDGLWALYSIDKQGIDKSYNGLTLLIKNALKDNEISNVDLERLKTAVRESPCIERTKFGEVSC